MTVRLALSEQDEKAIEKQLATGRFSDASEVVRAGLQILEEMNTHEERWLEEEVAQRVIDAERDPSSLLSVDDVFLRAETRHRERQGRSRSE
ncbi:type II toxin-antitoxin system ParD family antitoxin [Pseudorhizobium sp. NPDC055634]